MHLATIYFIGPLVTMGHFVGPLLQTKTPHRQTTHTIRYLTHHQHVLTLLAIIHLHVCPIKMLVQGRLRCCLVMLAEQLEVRLLRNLTYNSIQNIFVYLVRFPTYVGPVRLRPFRFS